jgi:pimeloyl-ACP methyl ester carboxylesterase
MAFATGHGGARIHYETFGEKGPVIVLIQGLGLSSTFWFDLPQRLVAATPPYRVVVLDNRGVGRSDRPRGVYRMDQMADDVAAVLDAAKIERAYVVGISMGGMIAQHVALRHPKRVEGLVLMATTPGLPHGRPPSPRALATLLTLPLARKRDAGIALSRILLPKRHQARAREIMARWPAALAAEPTRPLSFFAQFGAVLRHSTGFRLRRIQCPTVVVTGADDILVPPVNSRVLAKKIRGATLEVLPDVAHGIPLMDERVVHRAIARMRKDTPGASTNADRT